VTSVEGTSELESFADFEAAFNALLESEREERENNEGDQLGSAVKEELSFSQFSLFNLWSIALLALCVNGCIITYCAMRRTRYEVMGPDAVDERDDLENVDF